VSPVAIRTQQCDDLTVVRLTTLTSQVRSDSFNRSETGILQKTSLSRTCDSPTNAKFLPDVNDVESIEIHGVRDAQFIDAAAVVHLKLDRTRGRRLDESPLCQRCTITVCRAKNPEDSSPDQHQKRETSFICAKPVLIHSPSLFKPLLIDCSVPGVSNGRRRVETDVDVCHQPGSQYPLNRRVGHDRSL